MNATKRIGRTSYIKQGNILGEVKGPYKPGSVWKAEVYLTNKEFEACWERGQITPVQLGKVDSQADRVISAMSFGQTNAVDATLFTKNECLGYLYKRKEDAVKAVHDFFQQPKW